MQIAPSPLLAEQRLRALVAFGKEIHAQLEVRTLAERIPRMVVSNMDLTGAAVMLYDVARARVGLTEATGMGEDFLASWRERAETEEGLCPETELSLTLQLRVPVSSEDVEADERVASVRDVIRAAGMRRLLAVPLLARDEYLGVLVGYGPDRAPFDEDAVAYLGAIADQAAVAIHNARLYTQAMRELRRRDALRRVVESISSELDLGSLLERVVASAVELLEARSGSIGLLNSRGVARIRAVHNMPTPFVGIELPSGRGLTGQVIVSRGPVIVSDYNRDLPDPVAGLADLHAAIGVPVWWQGALVGVFAVYASDERRAFDDHDCEVMELLANHVAIAIENARLYGEVRERLAEVTGLQHVGALLLEERDFDRVLHAVCRQLLKLTDAGGVGLALLEENGQFLELRTVVGPSAQVLRGARIPVAHSFAGEALRTNQPQRSNDAQNDPRGNQVSLELGNTRSILSVPMKTRQRTVGAISIYNKRGESAFTDRDAELATLFATQAAVAIENARLYEQAREYAVVEERNRLARELHDSVTQSLFSVTLLSQAALSLWDKDAAKARERLERANELAQGALAEMRALIFELRPMALREEGLVGALKKHIAALKNRQGVHVHLRIEGEECRLPSPVEEAAFRIVQESVNNVAKHAEVTDATVTLLFGENSLTVSTEDKGVGFDAQARTQTRTMGMASMRERTEAIGGTFEIETAPGKGTRVVVKLPFRSREERGRAR